MQRDAKRMGKDWERMTKTMTEVERGASDEDVEKDLGQIAKKTVERGRGVGDEDVARELEQGPTKNMDKNLPNCSGRNLGPAEEAEAVGSRGHDSPHLASLHISKAPGSDSVSQAGTGRLRTSGAPQPKENSASLSSNYGDLWANTGGVDSQPKENKVSLASNCDKL